MMRSRPPQGSAAVHEHVQWLANLKACRLWGGYNLKAVLPAQTVPAVVVLGIYEKCRNDIACA